jgi:hypothetical protein
MGFSSILLPCHLLATGNTSFFDNYMYYLWVILPFFLWWFWFFFCFPSTTSFSFNALGTFVVEVDLRCFASYFVSGYNPWSALSEHTSLMIISITNFWSYSLSISTWLLIGKWEVDFSLVNIYFSLLVSWANLKLGYTSSWTCLLEFG